jgi:hypothetical protein
VRFVKAAPPAANILIEPGMPSPEWETYKISDKYAELATVKHIVHLPVARRIIEDGKIKSGLIFDKSRLKKSRISVTWLSANDWSPGSLYGTVEFQFSWEKLVKNKRIYWVEAMPSYHPAAFRFLLTFDEVTSELVTKYDPEKDNGPFRKVDGRWRWHPDYCSPTISRSPRPAASTSCSTIRNIAELGHGAASNRRPILRLKRRRVSYWRTF